MKSADGSGPFSEPRTRGYIAMLAVEKKCRRTGLGAALVTLLLDAMSRTCHDVSFSDFQSCHLLRGLLTPLPKRPHEEYLLQHVLSIPV